MLRAPGSQLDAEGVFMGKLAKPANRLLFALCVLITGAIAGAFVWAFFFCMDIGLGLLPEHSRSRFRISMEHVQELMPSRHWKIWALR